MSYWIVDFSDKTEGLYTLQNNCYENSFEAIQELSSSNMLTTNPDLESYACVASVSLRQEYFPVTLISVTNGSVVLDAVKDTPHRLLIGDKWEIRGKLRKIHPYGFEFSGSSGERFIVSKFALGEPDE